MTNPPRPLTEHRIARMLLWARVWLTMAVRLLDIGWSPLETWIAPALDCRLAQMRRLMALLIFIRAIKRIEPHKPHRSFGPRRAQRDGNIRIAIGCDLRRALRRRGWRAQVEALLTIVRDPEPLIAKLAKRLSRLRVQRFGLMRAQAGRFAYAGDITAIAFSNTS